MAVTSYPYADAYLARHVTPTRETQAIQEVGEAGTFPDAWVARLVVLRAYIITCLECQQSPEDLFTAKLASYRREYTDALQQARAAQQAADALAGTAATGGAGIFTLSLERA